jgi:hypothetical protein
MRDASEWKRQAPLLNTSTVCLPRFYHSTNRNERPIPSRIGSHTHPRPRDPCVRAENRRGAGCVERTCGYDLQNLPKRTNFFQ